MKGFLNKRLGTQAALATLVTLASVASAGAAVPGTMAVQGLLASSGGGAAADGDYVGQFSIYNVETGGSAAWTEGTVQLVVKNGRFSHVLGTKKPLTSDLIGKLTTAWLGLKVGADPELPRHALRSADKLAVMAGHVAPRESYSTLPPACVGFPGGPARVLHWFEYFARRMRIGSGAMASAGRDGVWM